MDSASLRLIDMGCKSSLSSSSCCSSFVSSTIPSLSLKSRLPRSSAVVLAAAKKDIDKTRKLDKHSFVSRPDEAMGLFPEAVLLKERKVEENGRLLPEFADAEERELFESLNLQLERDLKSDTMRHYEVVYLIHEKHRDEVENVNTKFQDFLLEKKGKIWRFSDWGMRRLAYRIQKAKNAHYILMNFELEAKWINEFKSLLDRDERVIRHLVMKRDKAETKECPPPPEFRSFGTDTEPEEEEDDDDDDEGIIYIDEDDDGGDEEAVVVKHGNKKQMGIRGK